MSSPRGAPCIFWVRERAIGKGIDFHEFGIRNGIAFHDFGIRIGIDFFAVFAIGIGLGMLFQKIGINLGIYFSKISIKSGIFRKIGIRNWHVLETSMARPRPKSGQVAPPPRVSLMFSDQAGPFHDQEF